MAGTIGGWFLDYGQPFHYPVMVRLADHTPIIVALSIVLLTL
jgi:hypothetical protein